MPAQPAIRNLQPFHKVLAFILQQKEEQEKSATKYRSLTQIAEELLEPFEY